MNIDLGNMKDSETHQVAISVKTNLRVQVKPCSGGRSQNSHAGPAAMSRSILIMAGGSGGHIFSADITRKKRAFPRAGTRGYSGNMASEEVHHG